MTMRLAPLNALFNACALALLLALISAAPTHAGVLPEDRADALYHRYQGGGVTIDGPSVLIRKKIGDHFSVAANYYMDMVSSASIDVKLSASPYKEQRTQKSLGIDYLHGKSTYSAGVIDSKETDYVADTAYFAVSQDMFGDLTTVSLSYKRGWNDIFRNVKLADGSKVRDDTFRQGSDTRGYSLGLSQILTRNMILALNYEVITDEGYLNSPYRSVRYFDAGSPKGFSLQQEIYPRTHTSGAASAHVKYYLPYRAALDVNYRYFTDTWGVGAHTLDVGYTHPAWKRWIFDARARYYRQTAADFYSDIFPRRDFANFLARDKELSQFSGITVGFGASYEFTVPRAAWIQKSTLNARLDHLAITYDNFRDATVTDPANGVAAGGEPLYKLNANVFEFFVSIWF
ncbi:MAG TPA: DUF3570 domain-containing protein [Steroidobacteraceae bacterium]|nr:DUF3570 domain-containing protein [Steroidobacteraceae bacterium]